MKIIRNYAVSILRDFQNEDLISILLHLTQTLRLIRNESIVCKSSKTLNDHRSKN